MALCDLPPELFTAIIGTLDLGSAFRLARTCQAFVGLGKDHRHHSLYSAVRTNDLKAFHRTVDEIVIPDMLVPISPPSEADNDLCIAVLACAWVLVVCRDCAAVEWWVPLTLLMSNLTPQTPQTPTIRVNSLPDKPACRLFARIGKAAATRSGTDLLDCLRQLKDAAPTGWLDLYSCSDRHYLPMVIKTIIKNKENKWARQQQLKLLPALLAIANGVSYFSCIPNDCILNSLVTTQDLALIVTFVLEQNRFGDKHGWLEFMHMLVSASIRNHKDIYTMLIKSYLVAIGPQSSSATQPLGVMPNITFSRPIDHVRKQLEMTYAFAGVSSTHFSSFMDYLHPSPFLDEFIPWLLTCDSNAWPKQYHDLKDLSWLVSHAHPHVSMVHALPFHKFENGGKRSIHTPQTLDLVLNQIPVDLVGQQMHLESPLASRAHRPFSVGAKCKRCRTLMRAARERVPTEPLLERFASGKWHVSYDPIPRDVWLAEARAVAHLIRSMDQAPTSKMWMDYVDSVAPTLVPRFVGEADGTVDWFGVRDAGANRLSVSAVILGLVYEERFDEIIEMLEDEPVGMEQLVDWARILDCVKSQVDRLQGQEVEDDDEDVRQEVLDNAAELVRALSGRCGKWMSEHCEFVEWAVAAAK